MDVMLRCMNFKITIVLHEHKETSKFSKVLVLVIIRRHVVHFLSH